MVGTAIAVGVAEAGYGYWALVCLSIASPLAATLGFWLITGRVRYRKGEFMLGL
jgi:PST family polysaccharide transporter